MLKGCTRFWWRHRAAYVCAPIMRASHRWLAGGICLASVIVFSDLFFGRFNLASPTDAPIFGVRNMKRGTDINVGTAVGRPHWQVLHHTPTPVRNDRLMRIAFDEPIGDAIATRMAPTVIAQMTSESFVLVMQIYSRTTMSALLYLVGKYSGLSNLERIIIVWNRSDVQPPTDRFTSASLVSVNIEVPTVHSINNRYRIPEYVTSRAVVVIDDAFILDPSDFATAFSAWRENPDRIVGFIIGSHDMHEDGFVYRSTSVNGSYSLVVIGALCLHVDFADLYWLDQYSKHREYVDMADGCDDILINMIATHATGKPPLHVRGHAGTLVTSTVLGMREGDLWYDKRSSCLNGLSNPPYFSSSPLRTTKYSLNLMAPASENAIPARHCCGADASVNEDCEEGGVIGALTANAEFSVTAVLTSFARPGNLRPIIAMLDARYEFIQEVIVINNDRDKPIDEVAGLESPIRTPLRVYNLEENMFTYAKYLGCVKGNHPVCYIQDDDYLPTNLRALYSAFTLRPQVMHAITDEGTYNHNMKWTFFDTEIGVHAGFAWLGTGSFVLRERVAQFMRKLDDIGIVGQGRQLADLYFSVWENEIPTTLISKLSTTGLDTQKAYSARGCSNCTNQRELNTNMRIHAVETLRARLAMPSDTTFNRDFVSHDFRSHAFKAACDNDECVLLTNVDIVPDLVARPTNFDDLHGHMAQGWIVPSTTVAFRRAVDGNDETAWTPGRAFQVGDFIGLDLLRKRVVSAIRVVASQFETGIFILEVSSSGVGGWRKKSFQVTSLHGGTTTGQTQALLIHLDEGAVEMRAFRLRKTNGPASTPTFHELSIVNRTQDNTLANLRILFVVTEVPPTNSSDVPTSAAVFVSRAVTLAAAGANVTIIIASTVDVRDVEFSSLRQRVRGAGASVLRLAVSPPEKSLKAHIMLAVSMLEWLQLQQPFQLVHFSSFESPMLFVLQARRVGLLFRNTLFVAHSMPTSAERRDSGVQFPSHAGYEMAFGLEKRSMLLAQAVIFPFTSVRKRVTLGDVGTDCAARLRLALPANAAIVLPFFFDSNGEEVDPPADSHERGNRPDSKGTRQVVPRPPPPASDAMMLFSELVVILDSHASATAIWIRILHDAIWSVRRLSPMPLRVKLFLLSGQAGEWLARLCTRFLDSVSRVPSVFASIGRNLSYSEVLTYVASAPHRFLCVLQTPSFGGGVVMDAVALQIPFIATVDYAEIVPASAREVLLFEAGQAQLARVVVGFLGRKVWDVPKTLVPQPAALLDAWIDYNSMLLRRANGPEIFRSEEATTITSNPSSTPTVSVYIFALQGGLSLKATVASVFATHYPASRLDAVIIIDGGDRTGMADFAAGLLGDRVMVVTSPAMDRIAAKKRIASAAKGDLVLFLSDNDVLRADALTVLVSAMQSTNADVVGGWMMEQMLRNSDPRRVDADRTRPMGDGLSAACVFTNCFVASGALHRRTALERADGWSLIEEMAHQMDDGDNYDLFVRETAAGMRLEFVPTVIYDHHKKSGVAERSFFLRSEDDHMPSLVDGMAISRVPPCGKRLQGLTTLIDANPELYDFLLLVCGSLDASRTRD